MIEQSLGVIWDVDGTLVDTAELHFEAWVRLAQEMGRPFSRADFSATFGRRNPEIIRLLFHQEFSEREIHEIGERKEGYYRSEAERGIALLPGVSDLVHELAEYKVPQAIGSSAPRGNLELILRLTDCERFFGAIVGMEDTQRGKPDPQVFEIAADRLGIPRERCVVFEDAIAGVQAAKAAGMACVGVTFVGHHSCEDLRKAGADVVIPSFLGLRYADVRNLVG